MNLILYMWIVRRKGVGMLICIGMLGGIHGWCQATQTEIDSLLSLAQQYEKNKQYNSSLKYYLQAEDLLSSQPELRPYAALIHTHIGLLYRNMGASDRAIEYFQAALNDHQEQNNPQGQLQALELLGDAYTHQEDYHTAIQVYDFLEEKLSQETSPTRLMTNMRRGIHVYTLDNQFDSALTKSQKLLTLYEAHEDSEGIAMTLNNMGFYLRHLHRYEEALTYFDAAYRVDRERGLSSGDHITTWINLGVTHQNQGDYGSALYYLLQADEAETDVSSKASIHNLMGRVYLEKGDLHNATLYVQSAIAYAKAAGKPHMLSQSFSLYSDVLQANNNFEEALEYYEQYLYLKDSLLVEDRLKDQVLIQQQNALEKSEQELRLILADERSQRQQLELDSERKARMMEQLESQNELQAASLREQKLLNEKVQQTLAFERQQRLSDQQAQEISSLQQQEEIQQLIIQQKEAKAREDQQAIDALQTQTQLLEEQKRLRDQVIEQNAQRQKYATGLGIALIILLIGALASYFLKRRDNLRLAQQKTQIEQANEELAQTLNQLSETQVQLVESEKMASLGQLTAGIAHEINNPINYVSSSIRPIRTNLAEIQELVEKYQQASASANSAEALQEATQFSEEIEWEYVLEETDHLLGSMQEGALKVKEIVHGLSNFTRLGEEALKSADLNQGLESTLMLLSHQLEGRIQVHKSYGDLPPVECYPGKINQVFINVITNAIQAIEEKVPSSNGAQWLGDIFLRTEMDNNQAVITIRDTGIGMTEEVKNRMFEAFYTTRDVGQGKGLGMTISFGIIEQHQGKIAVHSVVGEGTEVQVYLPLLQHTSK